MAPGAKAGVRGVDALGTVGAAAAAGAATLFNPLLGAAALVAGAVLEKPISQMFSYSYHVTGTWADPKVEKLVQTSVQPLSGTAEGGRK